MDVNEIKSQYSVRQLLEDKYNVVFKGNKALCPFHSEKTPSFSLEGEDRCKCFGCGQGGDLFDIIGIMENCKEDFPEQLRIFCDYYGVEYQISPEDREKAIKHREITNLLTEITEYFHKALLSNKEILQYVYSRGISSKSIKEFCLGYTSEGAIKEFFNRGYTIDQLKEVSLLNNGGYPFLQGRLFFPYWQKGKVVYGTAREIPGYTNYKEGERQQKYKKLYVAGEKSNSLLKNDCFYNEVAVKKGEDLFITEGVIDVILLCQEGFNALCPNTSEIRKGDEEKFVKFCQKAKKIYIVNDSEVSRVGFKGALKTSRVLACNGISGKVVILPLQEGEEKVDVADFLKRGRVEEFKELLPQGKDFIEWQLETLEEDDEEGIEEVILLSQGFKSIARDKYLKEIKKRFNVSKTTINEIVKNKENFKERINLQENIDNPVNTLKDKYCVDYKNNIIIKYQQSKMGLLPIQIADFSGKIEKVTEISDGETVYKNFEGLFNTQNGRKFPFQIEAQKWSNNQRFYETVLNICGTNATIEPKEERYVANAIQVNSSPIEEKIFTFTGWNEKMDTYLFPNYSVNKDGKVDNEDLNVSLPEGFENIRFTELEKEEIEETIQEGIVNGLLKVFDYKVTLPALATIFQPIIYPFIQSGAKKYATWIYGTTGSFKTAFSSTLMCFYGDFTTGIPTETWRSTMNAIEKTGFYLKDSLYFIDDFKKGVVGQRQFLFLQSYADGTARGRLNKYAQKQKNYPIRGFILSTGEDLPSGEASVMARILPIHIVGKGSSEKLSQVQIWAKKFSGVTPDFIEWFLNSNYSKKGVLKLLFQEEKQKLTEISKGMRGKVNVDRVIDNLSLSYLSLFIITRYFMERGVTREEADKIYEKYEQYIKSLILQEYIDLIQDESAGEIFLTALNELLSSKKAQLQRENYSLDPRAELIGFIEGDYCYINPKITMGLILKMLSGIGETLNFSLKAIYSQLKEDNKLAEIGLDGKTTIVKNFDGKKTRMICLYAKDFMEDIENKENPCENCPYNKYRIYANYKKEGYVDEEIHSFPS